MRRNSRRRHPGKHFSLRHLYLRSFVLSFVCALLALSCAAAITLVNGQLLDITLRRQLGMNDGMEQEVAQAMGSAEGIPVASGIPAARKEDCMTVLLMGVKDRESVSNTYLLVRFDPVNGRIPVLSLPPQTLVVKPEGDQTPLTLSEAYRFGGHTLAMRALSNTLDISIDRYAVVEAGRFIEIASMIGSIQYQLGQDLSYQDSERVIQLSKGMQLVDGQKALDIMTYPQYPGGDSVRAEVTAALAAQIINSRISLAASPAVESLFKGIVNRVETDITYMDFEQRRVLAASMAGLTPALQLSLDGGFGVDGREYTFSESALNVLQEYFGSGQQAS